ncbi:protein S100-A6 [Platysternon megacephalum]|uniref:Protein S100-A6 n=1 Tax=Platysternon megacephalum TaxID=55544 RepID=A0A4D9DPT9_9SAUR|nr:protein S100-A6 [Platysternon megacephalum]
MSFYKTPTDAKKPEFPLGAPVHVQKRRPLYTYFANEKGLLPNPVYHPEIEQKKQEDFMEPQPFVKEEKDKVQKNLLPALEEADSKAVVRMEEEPVYEDMATEGPSEDSDVKNHLIYPESWKDSDIVTITKPYKITAPVCNEWSTGAEPEAHEEVKAA